MNNKKAGFWSKLTSRLIDILLVAIPVVTAAFLIMTHSPIELGGKYIWHFVKPWTFYVWGLLLMFMLLLIFILIPLFTKGQTIGQAIMRIKVIAIEGGVRKAIIKREIFFAWTWMFTSILVFSIINHTLITKFASTDRSSISYNTWESLRIGIVSVVGSMGMLMQMIIGISVLVRNDKNGLHDIYAKSSVVYKNRFIEIPVEKEVVKKVKPKSNRNVPVEWM